MFHFICLKSCPPAVVPKHLDHTQQQFATFPAIRPPLAEAALLISNLILHDVPTECYVYEFSVLWKRGSRSAVAAALVDRGLWGRIQRVSQLEVACVAVSEIRHGEARLIDFVNWLRQYARWDRPCTGGMPPDAGRRAIMIGTCLLVDPNDGIHVSGDPRFVHLLGTRLAVRTPGALPTRAPYGYTSAAAPVQALSVQEREHAHSDSSIDPRGMAERGDSEEGSASTASGYH